MSETNPSAVDLHALVRSITAGSGLRGPREIAAKVAENVPDAALRAALAETLVPYVRGRLGQERKPNYVAAVLGNANSARSSKVAAIREEWRRTLAGQFHVGHGRWEVLADCTYEAVRFIAAERQEMARRNVAAAQMFALLAEAMREHGVERVGDLPDAVLAGILSAEDVAA